MADPRTDKDQARKGSGRFGVSTGPKNRAARVTFFRKINIDTGYQTIDLGKLFVKMASLVVVTEEVKISIKWGAKVFNLSLPAASSVLELKQRLSEETGVEVRRQRIIGLVKVWFSCRYRRCLLVE